MAITIKKAKRVRPAHGPGAAPPHLRRVSIAGLPPLHKLAFELVPTAPERGQWIVVLGDNGSGKTSLLRALALAIANPLTAGTYFATLEAERDLAAERVEISVWTDPSTERGASGATLQFLNLVDRAMPERPADVAAVVRDSPPVFGYGAARANALGGPERIVAMDPAGEAGTLFGTSTVLHAETWLRRERLRGTAEGRFFDAVLVTLATLLPGGETLSMEGDAVIVTTPAGARYPFAAMSDGYLTTLGWTIDLIARWAHRYRDTGKLDESFAKDMPCVVLVDELDLHLHPRWQLDIIPRLRAAFPKTTFVVTTHNPLTLQGTRPGEVFVLQKDEATGQISITQRDVPPGTDANRLLTGDWFGLGSTLDESTLRLLDAHRAMLLASRPETDPKRLEVESQLRQRIGHFADTSYERIAQGVVAELLDARMRSRGDITDADRQRVVQEVRARLAALDAAGAEEAGPTWESGTRAAKAPRARAKAHTKAKAKRSPTRRKP